MMIWNNNIFCEITNIMTAQQHDLQETEWLEAIMYLVIILKVWWSSNMTCKMKWLELHEYKRMRNSLILLRILFINFIFKFFRIINQFYSVLFFANQLFVNSFFIWFLVNKYLVYFIMFSQFSNNFVASSSFFFVLIENSVALSHQAFTFLIFAMNDFIDTFFNESFISISSSSNVFSDLEFISSDLTLLEKIRKT